MNTQRQKRRPYCREVRVGAETDKSGNLKWPQPNEKVEGERQNSVQQKAEI